MIIIDRNNGVILDKYLLKLGTGLIMDYIKKLPKFG